MSLRPDLLPNPAHIVQAIQANQIVCDCGQPATHKGWFVNITAAGTEIVNAMLLCDDCAALCDKDVEITGLNERPAWGQKSI